MTTNLEAEVDRLLLVIAAAEQGVGITEYGIPSDLIESTARGAQQECERARIGKSASRAVARIGGEVASAFGERLNAATQLQVALLGRLIDVTGDTAEVVLHQLLEMYGEG